MSAPAALVDDLLLWLVMASVGSALLMGVDKLLAKLGSWRISERSLIGAALVGGFLGIVGGAIVFHHKTSKASFWPGVVVAVALWCLLLFAVTR